MQRILVADDDPDLLRSVADLLENSGATVVRAADGSELLQAMAHQGPFALIVTDVAMPWMSGLQVMHSARYAGVGTPIVVMTALRDPSIGDRVNALGVDAVLLHKPFEQDDLARAVQQLLAKRRPN